MKKRISILLCCVLIFSSFSFAFADDWSNSQISSVVNNVSSINTTLSNIYTRVNTITNYLYDSNHSVAYWTSAIATWMQPIYTALTSGLQVNLGLDSIIAGLNEVVSSGGSTTYYPYLKYNGKSNANWLSDIYSHTGDFSGSKYVTMMRYQNGALTFETRQMSVFDSLNTMHNYGVLPFAQMTLAQFNMINGSYNSQQAATNWGNLGTSTFNPTSTTDGIYKWLSAIQTPVARLSYVLASEERIEAQEAASANEQAVVDNFIDSSGDGAASTSDFDSIAGFSSGYKSTFTSDASPTGIFDIFNSNNMGWFSQETANQLDTTASNNRAKSDNTFNTPLLDQQIKSIYEQLGVKQP